MMRGKVSIPCAGAVFRDPYAVIILDWELKNQGVIPNLPPNRQNLTHESGGFRIAFQGVQAARAVIGARPCGC